VEIHAQYEAQIAQAQRDGNKELSEQLQKQEGMSLHDAAVAEYMKTPRQKAQEANEQRKRQRAERTIEAREKEAALNAGKGGDGAGISGGGGLTSNVGGMARKLTRGEQIKQGFDAMRGPGSLTAIHTQAIHSSELHVGVAHIKLTNK
jgi:hypothetical protein